MTRSSSLARAIMPVLAAVAAATAVGCKDKGIHGDTGHQTMSGYAEGYNILIGEVPGLLERYFENTPADGPTLESLTEKKTWLCSGPGFFEMKRTEAKKAFAGAKSSANEELKHLGPMADALWEASMEIVSLSEEYCKYIQAEDFKDDKGAKAKEYHGKWTAVAEKYSQAQHAFSDALDKVEDAQMAKDIEKHAKDKGYSYWFRQFNHKAKAFMAQLRAEPKSLPQHYGDLEPVYNELSEFTKGKGAGLNSTFKSYQDTADRFFANVKKLNRSFAEAKDDAAREKVVEERFSSIVSDYNSLVTWYSSLTQAEGYDQLK
jgi:hypothetical protein